MSPIIDHDKEDVKNTLEILKDIEQGPFRGQARLVSFIFASWRLGVNYLLRQLAPHADVRPFVLTPLFPSLPDAIQLPNRMP